MYIKGFIANSEKHLEGELIGEWITFPISEEELNEVLKRIGVGENNYICPKCKNHMEELEYDSFYNLYSYRCESCGHEEKHENPLHTYKEYIFYDWCCDFEHDFCAYENIEDINYYAEQLKFWDEYTLRAACECWLAKTVLNEGPNNFVFYPLCYDEKVLGLYFASEINCINFHDDEVLKKYFDFERYGRDLALSMNGNFTNYGYIRQF